MNAPPIRPTQAPLLPAAVRPPAAAQVAGPAQSAAAVARALEANAEARRAQADLERVRQEQVGREQLRAAREEANRRFAETGSELTFEFDDATGRVVATLVDKTTREVIRQVPSEEMLAIARALAQGRSSGALVESSA